MPGLQELLDIATRHATAMADAMVLACFAKAHELGVVLVAPVRVRYPGEAVDWERMVRGNADTRWQHV